MNKRDLIIYRSVTGLLSLSMIFSAGMYFFNYAHASEAFTRLGFPTYVIYPLAILKILGVIAIWTNKSPQLKQWAYAGFFFNFLLAASSHIRVQDGEFMGAAFALVLLVVSYYFDRRLAQGAPARPAFA